MRIAKRSLLQSFYARAQARLVARSRILMQSTLLDGFIQRRNGFAVDLFRSRLVALRQGFTEFAEAAAQPRGVGPVAGGAGFGLAGALERRKVVCHAKSFTFVSLDF